LFSLGRTRAKPRSGPWGTPTKPFSLHYILIHTLCSCSCSMNDPYLHNMFLFTQHVLIHTIFSSCSCCRNGAYLHNMFLFTLSFLLVLAAEMVVIYTICSYSHYLFFLFILQEQCSFTQSHGTWWTLGIHLSYVVSFLFQLFHSFHLFIITYLFIIYYYKIQVNKSN